MRVAVTGYVEYFQDVTLKFCQLGYKAVIIPIAKVHCPVDHVFELLQQILGFRWPVVFTVGHEVIQALIPRLDIVAGRAFDQDDNLQRDLEQKQIRFDSFRRIAYDSIVENTAGLFKCI